MAAAIWSSDLNDVNQMPALFFIRFFKNHMLSVTDRPQWPSRSRSYIAPLTASFRERPPETPNKSVRKTSQGVEIVTAVGVEKYDAIVLVSQNDQSLALLTSQSARSNITSGIPYGTTRCSSH